MTQIRPFGAVTPMSRALLHRQLWAIGAGLVLMIGPSMAALFLLSRGIDVMRYLALPPMLFGLLALAAGWWPTVRARLPRALQPTEDVPRKRSAVLIALGLSALVMSGGMWFRSNVLVFAGVFLPAYVSWVAQRRVRGGSYFKP